MRFSRLMKSVFCAASLFVFMTGRASASPITIAWAPQSFDVTSTDFNDATMTFTAISASELVSINDSGGSEGQAIVHSHGGLVTWEMDVRLDGVWTQVLGGSVNF